MELQHEQILYIMYTVLPVDFAHNDSDIIHCSVSDSYQWRSQGAVAAVAPPVLDSDKKFVVSVVHIYTTSQSHFSFYEKCSVA